MSIIRFRTYDLIDKGEIDDGKPELIIELPPEDYELVKRSDKVEMTLRFIGNRNTPKEEDQ